MSLIEDLRRKFGRSKEPEAPKLLIVSDWLGAEHLRKLHPHDLVDRPLTGRPASVAKATADKQAQTRQAWAQAIERMPVSFRKELEKTLGDIRRVERELEQAKAAMSALHVPVGLHLQQGWMVERAALQQQIAQLAVLLTEQRADYSRLARNAAEYLQRDLKRQEAEAAETVADARQAQEDSITYHKRQVAAASLTREAIGQAIADVHHRHVVEQQLGYVVTTDPAIAEREQREAAKKEKRRLTPLIVKGGTA